MLMEVHMLKNYAPSSLNRDDAGSPKSCIFGGVARGRISSQCLKHHLRESPLFAATMKTSLSGMRTRKLPQLVAAELSGRGVPAEWVEASVRKITGFGNKDGRENGTDLTAQLIFVTPEEVKLVADCIQDVMKECPDIKGFEKIKAKDIQALVSKSGVRPVTLDIALFGRMVTSDAFRDVEASLQMAHAFSTNRLEREFDYYTAVDDLVGDEALDDAGAGMIGDTEFNSNCYYMYYNLDLDQLIRNLAGITEPVLVTREAAGALLRAFAYTNPAGKQNSFAAHQLPSAIYVELKADKIPVSYANAFLKPAQATAEKDLVTVSAEKLIAQINETRRYFNDIRVEKRIWFAPALADRPEEAEPAGNIRELLRIIEDALREVG